MEKIRNLLLVDDEEDIRDVLSIVLTDMGYDVEQAGDGKEALAVFQQGDFPLVITDIKMPEMDGIELLRAIKRESPDTEVIMITGHGDMDLAIKSLKYEAVDFVTKPINDDILEIALSRAGERWSMRKQLQAYTEHLEQLVEEKSRQLIKAERMAAVGETAAGLAHAIKNITSALSGGIFVLDKGFELDNPQYIRNGWKMVKSNTDRISRLSMELLQFSREPTLSKEVCDPNRPLREINELMKSQAEAYHLDFRIEAETGMADIRMDPEAVHRALMNLVNNAVYACLDLRCERAEKRIILRSRQGENGELVYEVEDTGCGMEEEVRARIFSTFFSTKGYDGTGLGLMVTRRIINAHDGTVEIASTPGEGTIVTLRLPRRHELAGGILGNGNSDQGIAPPGDTTDRTAE